MASTFDPVIFFVSMCSLISPKTRAVCEKGEKIVVIKSCKQAETPITVAAILYIVVLVVVVVATVHTAAKTPR